MDANPQSTFAREMISDKTRSPTSRYNVSRVALSDREIHLVRAENKFPLTRYKKYVDSINSGPESIGTPLHSEKCPTRSKGVLPSRGKANIDVEYLGNTGEPSPYIPI